jgi:MFS family permease
MPLFSAQLFGAFNDQFLKMALITLVTWGGLNVAGMEPAIIVPVAGAVFTAPFFLFSAMAGQVADKYDKALVLLRVKQAEIFIMLLAAYGFYIGSPLLLLTVVAMMGAQSAFFSPTRNAVLPQWLTDKELVSGNALMNGFVSVAILVGQIFGIALIVTKMGPQIVSGILVVFAFFGWLSIRLAPPAPSPNPNLKIDKWVIPEIFRTMFFAFKHPNVLRPMLGTAWYYWLSAGVLIIMPAYIRSVLYYDQNVLIVIMALFTLGALAGAMTCMIVSKGKEAIGLSAIGAFGIALFTFDFYVQAGDTSGLAFAGYVADAGNGKPQLGALADFFAQPNAKRFMLDLIGASFSASLFVVPLNAMAQRRADPKHRARLLAAGALLLNAATTLSQIIIAIIALTSLPMHSPFLVISVISLFIAIYAFYRARQTRKQAA